MNTEELAWAAGFFDGEGHVRFDDRGSRSIDLAISQNHIQPLMRFRAAVGLGSVGGPYRSNNPKAQPSWEYRSSRWAEIQQIACMLWPWLCDVKREQFRSVLERYITHLGKTCGHGNIRNKCTPCRSTWVRESPHYGCNDCTLESTGAGLAMHQRRTGHEGRRSVDAHSVA